MTKIWKDRRKDRRRKEDEDGHTWNKEIVIILTSPKIIVLHVIDYSECILESMV